MLPHPGDPDLSRAVATPHPAGHAARRSRTIFAWGWIVVHVGVPTVLLAVGARPAPFGWQMYSGAHPFPRVAVEVAGRAPVPMDMQPHIPHPRLELDYTPLILPFLCQQVPSATAVQIHLPGSPTPERHPCP